MVAEWIVIWFRDAEPPQVFPYDNEDDAEQWYDRLTVNWTSVFLCQVVMAGDRPHDQQPLVMKLGCHACAAEVGLSHMASSAGMCRGHSVDLENRLAEALAAVPSWVSVDDELPNTDTIILVVVHTPADDFLVDTGFCFHEEGEGAFWTDRNGKPWRTPITHWRRLPSLPNQD